MATAAIPDIRPANPNFSSGPCAKRPGFSLDALAGACLGRSHRAAEPKARLAEVIDLSQVDPWHPWRLAAGDRSGLRHRRSRDGAVVDAGRPRRRYPDLRKFRRRLGDRHRQASETAGCARAVRAIRQAAGSDRGRSGARRGVPLERHDVRRADAERRLDRRRSPGPGDLRCDVRCVRHGTAVEQTGCRDLVLAEGAGRGSRPRHAGAVSARGRAAGNLHARLAAAEDLPSDRRKESSRKGSSRAKRSTRRRCCAWKTHSMACAGRNGSAVCPR